MSIPSRSVFPVTLLASVVMALGAQNVVAHEPVMTMTSPNDSVIYVSGFPYIVSLNLSIVHDELKDLNQFDVTVDDVSIVNGPLKPFQNQNQAPHGVVCNDDLTVAPLSCSVSSSSTGSIGVLWTVSEPGTYAVIATVAHPGGGTGTNAGDDEAQFTLQLLSVEYPAPPAVANAYLNENVSKNDLKGKIRGCIISEIANNHAMESAYGPKGGPYNVDQIQADALALLAKCR